MKPFNLALILVITGAALTLGAQARSLGSSFQTSQSAPEQPAQSNPTQQPQTAGPQGESRAAQAPPRKSPLAAYAGTWTADFEGKPILEVKLALNGDQMTGSVRHPRSIELYDNGDLKSAGNDYSAEVLQEATITGDGLLLTVKDETTNELDRFSMQLTSESSANIKMLAMSMPPGMPKPKPWKLTKITTAAAAPHQ